MGLFSRTQKRQTPSVSQADNQRETAQEMFEILMAFGMSNPDIPQDVLEALDYVANYCGDVAHGREYKPGRLGSSDG